MLVLMRLIRSAAPVLVIALAFVAALVAGGVAFASDYGQPTPWQMGFQKSAAPTMDDITWFHDFLLWVITIITLFVLVLLLLVIVNPATSVAAIRSSTRSIRRGNLTTTASTTPG